MSPSPVMVRPCRQVTSLRLHISGGGFLVLPDDETLYTLRSHAVNPQWHHHHVKHTAFPHPSSPQSSHPHKYHSQNADPYTKLHPTPHETTQPWKKTIQNDHVIRYNGSVIYQHYSSGPSHISARSGSRNKTDHISTYRSAYSPSDDQTFGKSHVLSCDHQNDTLLVENPGSSRVLCLLPKNKNVTVSAQR